MTDYCEYSVILLVYSDITMPVVPCILPQFKVVEIELSRLQRVAPLHILLVFIV